MTLLSLHYLLLGGSGGPHVAASFLFLFVSDALDVEETEDGVCKTSEDSAGAVEGILWRENGDGLCNNWGMYETERDRRREIHRQNSH